MKKRTGPLCWTIPISAEPCSQPTSMLNPVFRISPCQFYVSKCTAYCCSPMPVVVLSKRYVETTLQTSRREYAPPQCMRMHMLHVHIHGWIWYAIPPSVRRDPRRLQYHVSFSCMHSFVPVYREALSQAVRFGRSGGVHRMICLQNIIEFVKLYVFAIPAVSTSGPP